MTSPSLALRAGESPLLLQFCIREVVPPEAVLNQLGGTALGQWLSADAPLQYVCWACRLVGG